MPELPVMPIWTVLFPNMRLPLVIFEPRYREMVEDCLERDRPFGVALLASGREVGGPARAHPVGTTARILDVQPLGGGRMLVEAVGVNRFQVRRLDVQPAVMRADVEFLPEVAGPADLAKHMAEEVAALWRSVERETSALEESREEGDRPARGDEALFALVGESSEAGEALPTEPVALSYFVAAMTPATRLERQRLLEAVLATDRLRQEVALLGRERRLQDVLRRHAARGLHAPLLSAIGPHRTPFPYSNN